jgi:hypothetical protein
MKRGKEAVLVAVVLLLVWSRVQGTENNFQAQTRLQPIAAQVRQLESLHRFLGEPFSQSDEEVIDRAIANPDPDKAAKQIEEILDKHALVVVTINSESLVRVTRGQGRAELVQNGVRIFLMKIVNHAAIAAPFKIESPNSGPVYRSVFESASRPLPPSLDAEKIRELWMEISLCVEGPLAPHLPNDLGVQAEPQLSGSTLEYRILLIYSRDAGQRSAKLSFILGQNARVSSSSNEITVHFNIASSPDIKLHVLDDDGNPTMASFIFRDSLGRVYPNPEKRLAPDFYFEPQVYRADGEVISLPPGSFTATFTGGPEYLIETQNFIVDTKGPNELTFHLKRWISPASTGWYSGDHHIHANGGAYYMDPTFGVLPQDMARQVRGEHLNVASVLNWGPAYYYQRQFFRGRQDNEFSRPDALLHYDLEVSGFPSSRAGHLVLLNLADQDYPGTKQIEDWPTWDLPILRWAKSQGATVGFGHAGGGLALGSTRLPNYEIPAFDAPGALESIVDVTYPNTVDFIGVGDGPFPYDLNLWYHTLNVGFRTRIAGETDLCCIYTTRVGMARTYAKVDGGALTYPNWMEAIRDGESYVSDGRSHLMDFTVNGTEVGTRGSEVELPGPGTVQVEANVAAYLEPIPDDKIRKVPFDEQPYWSIERARIGDTREVPVEVIVNGEAVVRQEINADGTAQKLKFVVPIRQSSWVALRIAPSAHTNPIFVVVGGKPIRASRRSAEWLLKAVDQCWSQNAAAISKQELPEARRAYEHARQSYQSLINESKVE